MRLRPVAANAGARPAPGRRYGATLHRERVHLTRRRATFAFTAAEQPATAGIDPFALLVDRVPDDNVMRVEVAAAGGPPARR